MEVLHWFNAHIWSQTWANFLTPSIWDLLGLVILDIRNQLRHNKARHTQREQLTDMAVQLEELSDKLRAALEEQ